LQTGLPNDITPEVDEVLFGDFRVPELAVSGHFERGRHDDFLTWVVSDRPADVLALNRHELQLVVEAVERGREAGGARPENDDVQRVGWPRGSLLGDSLDALASLLKGVPDQSHPPEFPNDVEPRHVGLEVLLDPRDVHTTLRGAEYELNRVHRTGPLAHPMADAPPGSDGHGLAVLQAQNVPLRTHGNAGAGPDTRARVHHGMDRDRLV
jgi:hypothetical protein